jgi:hypothetical protein
VDLQEEGRQTRHYTPQNKRKAIRRQEEAWKKPTWVGIQTRKKHRLCFQVPSTKDTAFTIPIFHGISGATRGVLAKWLGEQGIEERSTLA